MIENLAKEYGWAIDAFRRKFGHERAKILHERRGRSLKIEINGKIFTLYEASTTGGLYALNSEPNRWAALERMLRDADS